MRKALLFLMATASALGYAITSDSSQISLSVSRTGLQAGTRVNVKLFDASGQMLAQGNGRFANDSEPGQAARVSIRLDRAVDHMNVREVGAEIATPARRPISISHLAYALGPAYPRVMLVNEVLSRTWDGRYERYRVTPVDERSMRFDSIRLTGRVLDSQATRNSVEFWLELTDGRIFTLPGFSELKQTGPFSATLSLPEPIYRGEIKRFRVYSGRSPSYRITSFYQLFEETDDVSLRDVRVEGGLGGAFVGIRDIPLITMSDHRLYQSPDLSGTDAPTGTRVYRPQWFNVYLMTGNDDLRWDPNVQPNMEVRVNLYIRGNRSPIPIVSRSLNPYATFANGGVWGGSFAGYDIAERIAPWRSETRPPRIQDIEAIEVETIPGWDGSTPQRRVLRGQGDPFRQPDTWAFRGIWVGASETLPERNRDDRQHLVAWHTLVCDFGIMHRMQVGQKVRFPVRVVEGRRFDPDIFRRIVNP